MGLAPGQRVSSEMLTESIGIAAYRHVVHSLTYQHDGNLVLYRTSHYGAPDVGGAPNFGLLLDKLLEAAASGDLVDGKIPDGQLGDSVIEAVWSTGTSGRSAGAAVMQNDGNFVVYDADNQPVWNSGTSQYAADYLWLRAQRDGNVVLYKGHADGEGADKWVSVWSTGTAMPA
jgi:hypothetical protein